MRSINLQGSIFAIVALATVISVQGDETSEGPDRYHVEVGNLTRKRYRVAAHRALNWTDAVAHCSQHNLDIATILSSYENENLPFEFFQDQTKNYWIGARRAEGESYRWYPKNESLTFQNWWIDDATWHVERCVALGYGLKWLTAPCDAENAVICQEFTQDPPSEGIEENLLYDKIIEKEYIFPNITANYTMAPSACRSLHAQLVSINSAEEKIKLFQAMKKIIDQGSITSHNIGREVLWIKDSAVETPYFYNIRDGMSSDFGGKGCMNLAYVHSGLTVSHWVQSCDHPFQFICEKIRS